MDTALADPAGRTRKQNESIVAGSLSHPPIRRLTGVDGLRGIAALSVAWFHLYNQNGGSALSAGMPQIMNLAAVWGRFGVQLFFVISGFVIMLTLYGDANMTSGKSLLRYFVRRSVRLDPTYWFALLVYILITPFILSYTHDYTVPRLGSKWDISVNILYFLIGPSDPQYVPVVWTLIVEVQFYVVISLIVVLSNRLAATRSVSRDAVIQGALYALIFVGFLQVSHILEIKPLMRFWLYPNINTFVAGIAAAFVYLRTRGAWVLFFSSLFAITAAVVIHHNSYAIAGLVFAAVVLASALWSPLVQALSSPVCNWLGRLSYCIYLFHIAIGAATIEVLKVELHVTSPKLLLLLVVFGVLTTILFSIAVHQSIERPSIRLSKRIR